MEGLRDIQGLDSVSAWPLALGWWIMIMAGVLLLALTLFLWVKHRRYQRSWQYQAYKRLDDLEQQSSRVSSKDILQSLSEQLRYIAISQLGGREVCAGLWGQQWLNWLTQHDPTGYNWSQTGKLLIQGPYGPQVEPRTEILLELIAASKQWVKKC